MVHAGLFTLYGEQQYHSNSQCMDEAFAARDSVGLVIRKCGRDKWKFEIKYTGRYNRN